MRPTRVLAGALLGLGLLGGCASTHSASPVPRAASGAPSALGGPSPSGPSPSGPASGGTASPAGDVCAASANLTASVKDLTSLTMSEGLPGLQTKVQAIQTNLDAFQAAAHSNYGPQVAAFRSALTNLQTAVKALTASPSAAAIAGLVPQVSALVTAWNGLQQAVAARCG